MIQRLYSVQALRGLAACLVVVSHLGAVETKYAGDPVLPAATILGFSGVDLFFAISGFIMVYVTQGRLGSLTRSGSFLFSRVTRIYPLYWLVSAALIVVWLRYPDMVFASATGSPDVLKSLLLWPESRPPLLAVGWTLIHELYFYFVFAALVALPARALPGALAIWGAGVALGAALGLGGASPVLAIVFHPLTFEFLAGAIAGMIFTRLTPGRAIANAAALIGAGGFIAALIASQLYWPGSFPDGWARAGLFAGPCALLVFGAAGLERAGAWRPAVALSRLGDWSYALYLTHVVTLSALGRLWSVAASDGAWDNAAALAALFAGAVFVAWLTHAYAERPMLTVTRSLRRRWFGADPALRQGGAP